MRYYDVVITRPLSGGDGYSTFSLPLVPAHSAVDAIVKAASDAGWEPDSITEVTVRVAVETIV